MLGLTACAMARTIGARAVIVTDVDAERLEFASRFGATHAVQVDGENSALAALVRKLTAGRGVDLALELSGAPGAIESGLNLLRIGGRYVLVGSVFPGRPVALSPETVVRRLLTIQGVHNYAPEDLAAAVAFLSQQHERYPFAELVTKPFSLSEAERAFAHAIGDRPLRAAVRPDADSDM
jgi:threonine dehydrogenase-like Zn-dependent dehydrogenase